MPRKRCGRLLLGVALMAWGLLGMPSFAQAQERIPIHQLHAIDHDLLLEGSSDKDPSGPAHVPCEAQSVSFDGGSTWQLCVGTAEKFGFVVSHANFQKSPSELFINVLFDGRIGEIFVPYHPGSPRFKDIGDHMFFPLPLSPGHCPPPRVIIGDGTICRETRDRGLAWMDDALVRRGQEVVYWAVLDAANYNYIMEWAFHDDGTIVARAGSTGPKYFENTGHMHDFTWRLDVDLNGPGGDSCHLTEHREDPGARESKASDSSSLILTEGRRIWNALPFNTLEILDSTLKNGNGRRTSYELVPLRTGTARHSEAFTKADFWLTRFSWEEILAMNLPRYVADAESTVEQDNVIWYTGSAHHSNNMRDEDKQTVPVIWVGFELVPQNLFEGTPFY